MGGRVAADHPLPVPRCAATVTLGATLLRAALRRWLTSGRRRCPPPFRYTPDSPAQARSVTSSPSRATLRCCSAACGWAARTEKSSSRCGTEAYGSILVGSCGVQPPAGSRSPRHRDGLRSTCPAPPSPATGTVRRCRMAAADGSLHGGTVPVQRYVTRSNDARARPFGRLGDAGGRDAAASHHRAYRGKHALQTCGARSFSRTVARTRWPPRCVRSRNSCSLRKRCAKCSHPSPGLTVGGSAPAWSMDTGAGRITTNI